MEKIICIVLLSLSTTIFAQIKEIKGIVLNENKQPIAFTTIYNKKQNVGVYSDSIGVFKIKTPKTLNNLTFSALGYEEQTFFLKNDTISFIQVVLKSKSYELNEISVRPINFNKKTILIQPKKKNKGHLKACSSFAYQCGIYFPLNIQGELKSVSFLVQNKYLENSTFRVRIYNIDENEYPNKDLLFENIIVNLPKGNKEKLLQINLEQYRITIPKNGVIVALEWIKSSENSYTSNFSVGNKSLERECFGPFLILTKDEKKQYTMWSKQNEGKWFKNSFRSSSFRKRNTNNLVPVIGIEIKEYK